MKYLNLQGRLRRRQGRISQKFTRVLTVVAVFMLGVFVWALLKGPGESFRFIFQEVGLHSNDGKVNVLLLGNAGGIHQGSELTDTIMVVSYDLKTSQAYLISLPRDLWIEHVKGKANSIYEIGEAKGRGEGLTLSKKEVGDILGVPIYYGIRVDFSGFVKAVDLLGGIDVEVSTSFEDNLYPIEGRENDLCGLEEQEVDFSADEAKKLNVEPGKRKVLIDKSGKIATDSAEPERGFKYFPCRFEYIAFQAGQTHMDGALALKFVRSRMGTNSEGSDFARSKRQQLALEAFRKKALSLETLSSPLKVSGLLITFGQSFETDIPTSDIPAFLSLIKKVEKTHSFVLISGKEDALLINPPAGDYGGVWVLVPRTGNFNEIHSYIGKILRGEVMESEASSSARPGSQ